MNSPVRRPPLKTEDVRQLLKEIDQICSQNPANILGASFDAVANAVGFVTQWPTGAAEEQALKEGQHTCTVCRVKFSHEPIYGEFCSTKCEDWAFDNPDKPPYAPKGGKNK